MTRKAADPISNGRDSDAPTRAESPLQAGELCYRQLVDMSPDGIVVTDEHGVIHMINRSAAEQLGRNGLDDIAGLTLVDLFSREDRRRARSDTRRAQNGGQIHGVAYTMLRQDGSTFPAEITASPVKGNEDKPTGMMVVIRDITEREQAFAPQAHLAAIVESSDDAIIGRGLDGIITSWNPGAERLYGYSAAEAVGRSIELIVPPDKRDALWRVNERIKNGEPVQHFETVSVRKGNLPVEVSVTISPVKNSLGQVVGASNVSRDISQRSRAKNALWQSEERLRLVLETMAEGVLIVDPEGRITFANAAAERILDLPRDATVERKYIDLALKFMLVDGQLLPDHDHPTTRALHFGEPASGVQLELERASGSHIVVSASAAPIRNAEGMIIGVVTSFADITERARSELMRLRGVELEEQNLLAQEANRLKSEFLAGMSHEIRTPLYVVMGFAELLHEEKVGPLSDEQREYLGDIITSSQHVLQIINDVLDLAKVEAGRLEFYPELLDLNMVVAEVCDLMRSLAADKKIVITAEVDASLDLLKLDSGRLKQVLLNYLSNAVKFTPNGGSITIKGFGAGPDRFKIEVRDTGIGISPEGAAQLFVEFHQLGTGAARSHLGSGLGLALTKRIVEAQGGTVGVESRLGKGSCFFAVLPRKMTDLPSRPDLVPDPAHSLD